MIGLHVHECIAKSRQQDMFITGSDLTKGSHDIRFNRLMFEFMHGFGNQFHVQDLS